MYPSKKDNIYPYSKENLDALLNYYFDIPFGDIDWLFNQSEWQLNQIEYVAMKVNEHIEVLNDNLGPSGSTVSNLMSYGIDAIFKHPNMWRGSKNRRLIIALFHDSVFKNE